MIDVIRWLLSVEIVGLAFLPLTGWILRWLPDRGYIFAKILGLLLITYVTWIVGSFLPVAGPPLVPVLTLLLLGAGGWWLWGRGTVEGLRGLWRVVAVEEALFLAGVIVWSALRVYVFNSAVSHTEQFMDMAFLNASLHSASYPPYDPWMSGHTINYYYMGYLMFATLIKLSGVAPAVGYNLALSFLFAFTVAAAYSLGFALARSVRWAAVAPLFVALIGNWHAILTQIPQGQLPTSAGWWIWDSSRVVGANDATINEFPLFSFILGDLHPHVMALPLVLLALACGGSLLLRPTPFCLTRDASTWGQLLLIALCVGVLYTVNSWDLPTYALVVGGCLVANAYISDTSVAWWHTPVRVIPALAAASVVLFVPFYLRFQRLDHGLGLVTTRSDPAQFLQVFGLFFLACALLTASLAFLLRPAEEVEEERPVEEGRAAQGMLSEHGQADPNLVLVAALIALLIVGVIFHSFTLALILAMGAGAVLVLWRVVDTEEPNRADVLALILVCAGCLVLALTEVIYVRDSFDGSYLYRMNTVFKFFYQAWVLLGLAGAYGAYRGLGILRQHLGSGYRWAAALVLAFGTAGGGAFTVFATSAPVDAGGVDSLSGMAWVQRSFPGDYAVIQWLSSHVPDRQHAVELEATGTSSGGYQGGYTDYGLISTFTGLPAVIAWADHEGQWRPGDGDIEVRVNDVRTIYTTTSIPQAERLLHAYHVRYVVVGEHERSAYNASASALAKFGRFMRIAYQSDGATVYTW